MNEQPNNQNSTTLPAEQPGLGNNKIKEIVTKLLHSKLFILAIIIILIATILFLRSWFSANEISSTINEASQAVQAGEYDKAIALYTAELKKNKGNEALLTGVMQAIALKGNATGQEEKSFEEIKPYIGDAIKTGSTNAQLLQSIGYGYETAGMYSEALAYYDKAVKLAPDSANAWFHHGHVLEFLGKTTEAYSDYDKAYSLDKNNPQILMARGNMFMSQGKLQNAYETFKQSAGVPGISNVSKSESLTGASIARASQDSFKYIKEAVQLSKSAVDADPHFSPALAEYGYNLFLTDPTLEQGLSDGISYAKKAIAANPRIAKNYYMLGLFYRGNKDYTNALTYFQEAIAKLDQDNTVLSTDYKNKAKGLYLYDLAKTYSIANVSFDTLSLLKQAFILDPTLKEQVKKDIIINNYFKELKDNQELINLINN